MSLVIGAVQAQGATFLYFNSEPGDPIGLGHVFTLTPADGTFTTSRAGGGVEVRISGPSYWNLHFVPPTGAILNPGIYEGATRWPFQSPLVPGLDVSGNSRGCNTLTGRFTVLEADYGPSGEVVRFAADYEQHCDGHEPALFGSVRINSSVTLGPRLSVNSASVYEGDAGSVSLRFVVSLSGPATSPVAVGYATVDGTATAGSDYAAVSGTASFPVGETVAVVTVPAFGDVVEEGDEMFTFSLSGAAGAPIAFAHGHGTIRNDDPDRTLLYFDSQPGDWVGRGQRFTLTPADGDISTTEIDGGLRVAFSGATWWSLYFVPPAGTTLAVGVYDGAMRWPFQSPVGTGLDVSGNGRGCNTLGGRFTVLEVEYAPGGELLRFAADYEQRCGGIAPALFGSVRINSSVARAPRLSVSSATVYEGDAGSGAVNLKHVVSLSSPAISPVTVAYGTLDGSATAGSDYDAGSGTASFGVGETAVVVTVPVIGDTVEEEDETFALVLSDPVGAPIAFGQGLGTIRDDDPFRTRLYFNSEPGDVLGMGQQFTLTPADGTFTLSDAGGGVHVVFHGSTWWELFFVPPAGTSLTPGAYEGAARWPFQSPTGPGLSVYGDFRGCNTVTGRFTVLEVEYGPGGEVQRFAVDYEQHCDGHDPALFGSVRFNSAVSFGPRLSASSATMYEGDAGSSLRLMVALSAPSSSPVTVGYATSDGSATAGSDYAAVSGTASFPVGETVVAVSVPVLGDAVEEGDETFTLSLSNAVGAPIAFAQGEGRIRNDDPYKTLLSFNSEPGEYVGGGQRFSMTPADGNFSTSRVDGGVHVAFIGAALWDLYFVPPSGFALTPGVYPGATRWPFQFPTEPGLNVAGDGRGCTFLTGRFTVLEAEYGPGGDVLRFAADYEQHCGGGSLALFGSVRINSSVSSIRRVAVTGTSVVEGNSGTRNLRFPVWLSDPAETPVTVTFATSDGTATSGSDYLGYSGSITVPAGETDAEIPVPVLGDTVIEDNEGFLVSLTGAVGAVVAASDAVGTILDDDLPQLSVNDVSVVEGNPGSPSQAVFTVSMNIPSGETVTVSYVTEPNTATAGDDFTSAGGTVTFAPGTTSATVIVPVVPDLQAEDDETFQVRLFSPSHAAVSDSLGIATIVDDDPDPPPAFHTVIPCRLYDSRGDSPVRANQTRTFNAGGICAVPTTAVALVVNITAVAPTDMGDFRLYAHGAAAPDTSVLNFARDHTRAGNTTVMLGLGGALSVQCDMPAGSTGATHLVVDVFGYYE